MVAIVLLFLGLVARFYVPEKGFTALIKFGGNYVDRYIPELKALSYFNDEQSFGYDAQWYAQISLRPDPRDPEMMTSVDNLPYRARRILFCWTAYALGFGNPAWILQVYALMNVVCWLALAWLMLRWFPPQNWENVLRWAAVLFSYGLCVSVRASLVDGPSLLLIALGVALFEKGRTWSSTLVLGAAGLGKETNILGAAVLAWPKRQTLGAWTRIGIQGLCVLAPLLIWTYALYLMLGPTGGNTGARAFAGPFLSFWDKLQLTVGELAGDGARGGPSRSSLYMLVSLAVQFAYIAFRPQWRSPWWRVGAAYAVLMVFLGEAVWEGYPGAASRVLLPLTLAFNVLLPRGRKWWLVLLLGNLTVLTSIELARPPESLGYRLRAPQELTAPKKSGEGDSLNVTFGDGWYGPERSNWDYWRWSEGDADLRIYNPTTGPLYLRVEFALNAGAERKVIFGGDQGELWSGTIEKKRTHVKVEHIVLVPGTNRLWWKTPGSAEEPAPAAGERKLVFRLYNLKLTATRE